MKNYTHRDKVNIVKERLWQWAEYILEPIPGLSYPSSTVESRLMIEGANGGTPSPQARIPKYKPHPRDSMVDRSLQELTKRQREIIDSIYIDRDDPKDFLKDQNFSMRTYMRDNKEAHEIIGRYIGISL